VTSVVDRLKDHARNVRGLRTGQRIVVFESDDWGAIRMPSRAAFEALNNSRNGVELSRYDAVDCLENEDDLEALSEVLSSVADAEGRPGQFTANMVMGNPDFDAIRDGQFERFVHEPFHVSYERYHGKDLRRVWRELASAGLVRHQFHAREHLNAPFWLADLRAANPATQEAFDQGFYGLKCRTGRPGRRDYLAAYDPATVGQLPEYWAILEDGLRMYEEVFGEPSLSMVPCNYVWPEEFDEVLAEQGTRFLQGSSVEFRITPGVERFATQTVRRRFGARRRSGLHDLVRNVTFEPYRSEATDHVDRALQQVRTAFFWGKPAVICTHRINYVAGMRPDLRDRHLQGLRRLLEAITKQWPDAAFRSSDELARMVVVP